MSEMKIITVKYEKGFHYSINPPIHYSFKIAHERKTIQAPSGGSSKPATMGPASLLFFCPGKNKDNFFYPVNGFLADAGCTFEPCKIWGIAPGSENGRARVL
jgi:hypothetical protein